MKVVCVIPSRYGSTRFPGKPLVKIAGEPMIYWVWKHCSEVKEFSEVYIATDDIRIKDVAESFGAMVIMTPSDCKSPTDRIYLVSDEVEADYYVMVNGDESLMMPEYISKCIPSAVPSDVFVTNLMTDCNNATDVVDVTNIKVVVNSNGRCIFLSRSPIPYPKNASEFVYQKFVGVTGFTKAALDYYHNTPKGFLETTEDVDELRFVENAKEVKFVNVHCKTLSVDTVKDVAIVESRIKHGIYI